MSSADCAYLQLTVKASSALAAIRLPPLAARRAARYRATTEACPEKHLEQHGM